MQELLAILNSLKTEDVSKIVRDRVNDFKRFQRGPSKEIFNELCFCILTANCSAEKCIEVQNTIGNKFHDLCLIGKSSCNIRVNTLYIYFKLFSILYLVYFELPIKTYN